MNQEDIQREILKTMYTEWAAGYSQTGLLYLAAKRQRGEQEFNEAADDLERKNLIKVVASDRHARLTANGILRAELEGIAPADLSEKNRLWRTRVLERLAQSWDENGSRHQIDVNERKVVYE